MNDKNIKWTIAILFLIGGLIATGWWLFYNPVSEFVENIPGMDGRPENLETQSLAAEINIGEHFILFDSSTSTMKGSWPRFRGENFDNISTEKVALIDNLDDAQSRIKWSVDLGEGHAAPAIYDGFVYLLDYAEQEKADVLRCFSLETSKEMWKRWYNIHVKRNHGMSRTVPAVTEKYVVTIGPKCHVMGVDRKSGDFLWGIDLEREYNTKIPLWYTGQCALIDDSVAVIASGGKALMFGVDCDSGKVVWQTPNPDGWQMSHSSIMPMTIHGKRTYVYCAVEGVIGVSAENADRGTLLWKTTAWAHSVIAPSPLYLGDGRILLTAGYGAGSMVIKVNPDYTVEELIKYTPKDGIAAEQQTPILFKDHLFGILPKDAGPLKNQFVCCHKDDCTKILWSSGKEVRFGLGPFIIADGKFFVLDDEGVLTIVVATTTGYEQLAQAKILDGHDAWGPFALVDGRLLLRDSQRMVCLDIRK